MGAGEARNLGLATDSVRGAICTLLSWLFIYFFVIFPQQGGGVSSTIVVGVHYDGDFRIQEHLQQHFSAKESAAAVVPRKILAPNIVKYPARVQ